MTTQTQTISRAVYSNPLSSVVQGITKKQFLDMMLSHKGCSAVTIVAKTVVKTGHTKVSRVNGMIGFRYANSVNNQLAREDKETDFVAQPRRWGNHIPGTPLIENKGSFYLEFKVEKSLDYRYEDCNGNPLSAEETEKVNAVLASKYSKPKTQGTQKEIILRDYSIENILSITYKGICYLITH